MLKLSPDDIRFLLTECQPLRQIPLGTKRGNGYPLIFEGYGELFNPEAFIVRKKLDRVKLPATKEISRRLFVRNGCGFRIPNYAIQDDWFAMEYIHGLNLEKILEIARLTLDEPQYKYFASHVESSCDSHMEGIAKVDLSGIPLVSYDYLGKLEQSLSGILEGLNLSLTPEVNQSLEKLKEYMPLLVKGATERFRDPTSRNLQSDISSVIAGLELDNPKGIEMIDCVMEEISKTKLPMDVGFWSYAIAGDKMWPIPEHYMGLYTGLFYAANKGKINLDRLTDLICKSLYDVDLCSLGTGVYPGTNKIHKTFGELSTLFLASDNIPTELEVANQIYFLLRWSFKAMQIDFRKAVNELVINSRYAEFMGDPNLVKEYCSDLFNELQMTVDRVTNYLTNIYFLASLLPEEKRDKIQAMVNYLGTGTLETDRFVDESSELRDIHFIRV